MESYSYQNGSQNRDQDFQKLSQTIASSIQKMSQNVSSMQRMINQIGTHQDSKEIREKLESIQNYTHQLAKDINGYIRDLHSILPASSQSEQRQRKMQCERLQDEYTSALNMFQAAQRSIVHKQKEQVNRTKAQIYGEPYLGLHHKKDEQLIELQDSDGSRQQQTQMQDEIDLRALQEQENAISQLEADISDVNNIFKELGALVHEQGEVVENIETSIERTLDQVTSGAQQLREAGTYKNKIRKKKLIIAGVAGIILLIIIIIIVVKTS